MSYSEKIRRGKIAIQALIDYKDAVKHNDQARSALLRSKFEDQDWLDSYFKYFGYGYYDNPADLIPPVPISFYSFHLMVSLGVHFMVMFLLSIWFVFKGWIVRRRWFLVLSILTIPLVYIASMSGWILAEFGRQPWVIQDIMPTIAAVSAIDTSSVQITFWLFVVVFTTLLLAEVKIMLTQIKKGPKIGE